MTQTLAFSAQSTSLLFDNERNYTLNWLKFKQEADIGQVGNLSKEQVANLPYNLI